MSSSDVHPSAVGTNTQPERASSQGRNQDSIYPPQRHAGAVGLGPEYGKGTGFGEKLAGLQEEIKGKILRKPELVEHGRERRTGELKKKVREKEDTMTPPVSPQAGAMPHHGGAKE